MTSNLRGSEVIRAGGAPMGRSSMLWFVGVALLLSGCIGGVRESPSAVRESVAMERRALRLTVGDRWIGDGICYSPYRDGQRPGGVQPTREEIRQDMAILSRRWSLLRTYGAREGSETLLQVIREDGLPMHVILGVWIAPEVDKNERGDVVAERADDKMANEAEVRTAIRLAKEYPEIVVAIGVGNDTQVSWSPHRSDPETLLTYVREVRRETPVPVTTADDFAYWRLPESREVSAELDFVMVHIQPLSNGATLDDALDWTRARYAEIATLHAGVPVVIGESGWSTDKRRDGESAKRMPGVAGEAEQQRFFRDYTRWIADERIVSLWFEAFDENWKGSDHPQEVEKHWGLYRADRSPKRAVDPDAGSDRGRIGTP